MEFLMLSLNPIRFNMQFRGADGLTIDAIGLLIPGRFGHLLAHRKNSDPAPNADARGSLRNQLCVILRHPHLSIRQISA